MSLVNTTWRDLEATYRANVHALEDENLDWIEARFDALIPTLHELFDFISQQRSIVLDKVFLAIDRVFLEYITSEKPKSFAGYRVRQIVTAYACLLHDPNILDLTERLKESALDWALNLVMYTEFKHGLTAADSVLDLIVNAPKERMYVTMLAAKTFVRYAEDSCSLVGAVEMVLDIGFPRLTDLELDILNSESPTSTLKELVNKHYDLDIGLNAVDYCASCD